MRQRRFTTTCAIALCAAFTGLIGAHRAAAWPIDLTDPPEGVFLDEWMSVELANAGRVGYLHSELSRQGDRIKSMTLMSMTLKRMGQPVDINVLQTSVESLDGKPVAFDHRMDMSVQQMHVKGVIEDDRVKVTTEQYGQTVQREYDFPDGARLTWGTLLEQNRQGFEAGTSYKLLTYDPSTALNAGIELSVRIVGPEKLSIDGETYDAILTRQTINMPNMPMGIESKAWVLPDGRTLRTMMQLAGMNMVMNRSTKDEALAEFSPPEFFMPTTIEVDAPIDRTAARRIDYTLRTRKEGGRLPPIPRTAMQRVIARENGLVKLAVQRLDVKALKEIESAEYADNLREYLEPNAIINSDDPEIQKMAARARQEATAPYKIADNLRRFVTAEVKSKNLNVGFASASEVCRNREGDCSEHAVLLAALGRASGLPTRVVTGIVYVPVFGGKDDIFGFHMWTQFLIGDTWVDFDAAQRESDCNPTHIAFSVDSLDSSGLGQIAFPLANVIGNLELKVDRIEPPVGKEATSAADSVTQP